MAALVGPTGAGKSTIISLIPRFYDPTSGVVKIDGQDVRRFQQKSLRQQISFVLQETLLFHGPIWNNIAYGKPEATRAEILRAAEWRMRTSLSKSCRMATTRFWASAALRSPAASGSGSPSRGRLFATRRS